MSKAFRNRFMEIHVGDIPDDELRIILNKRCSIAPSYAAKIVAEFKDQLGLRNLRNYSTPMKANKDAHDQSLEDQDALIIDRWFSEEEVAALITALNEVLLG